MWEPSIAARDWNGGPLSSSARRSFLVLVMLHFLLNGTASVISSQRSHRLFTEDPDDDDLMENKKRGLVVAEEWQYEQIGPTLVSPYYHNVAVSGDGRRLVVGDDTHDNSRGRVTIYELNEDGNVWEEVGNFSGLVEGDKLSRRGSLLMTNDGNRIFAGSQNNGDDIYNRHTENGNYVLVFDRNPEGWIERPSIVPPQSDRVANFSWMMAASDDGTRVVVMGYENGDPNAVVTFAYEPHRKYMLYFSEWDTELERHTLLEGSKINGIRPAMTPDGSYVAFVVPRSDSEMEVQVVKFPNWAVVERPISIHCTANNCAPDFSSTSASGPKAWYKTTSYKRRFGCYCTRLCTS